MFIAFYLHPLALAITIFLLVGFTCAKVVEKLVFAKSTTPPVCQSLKPCSQFCPMVSATAKSKLTKEGPSSATGYCYPFLANPFMNVFSVLVVKVSIRHHSRNMNFPLFIRGGKSKTVNVHATMVYL